MIVKNDSENDESNVAEDDNENNTPTNIQNVLVN